MKMFGLELPYCTYKYTHLSLILMCFFPSGLSMLVWKGPPPFLLRLSIMYCVYVCCVFVLLYMYKGNTHWKIQWFVRICKNTLRHTNIFLCSPSSLFLLPTSAAELIPRMPLMEYEEPAESLVTAETCVAATDVAADRSHHGRNRLEVGIKKSQNRQQKRLFFLKAVFKFPQRSFEKNSESVSEFQKCIKICLEIWNTTDRIRV